MTRYAELQATTNFSFLRGASHPGELVMGAAALMAQSGEDPATLRKQVTSPNGTTQAALEVLTHDGALERLLTDTVAACVARSRELAGS